MPFIATSADDGGDAADQGRRRGEGLIRQFQGVGQAEGALDIEQYAHQAVAVEAEAIEAELRIRTHRRISALELLREGGVHRTFDPVAPIAHGREHSANAGMTRAAHCRVENRRTLPAMADVTWHHGPPLAAQRPRILAELVAVAADRAAGRVVIREGRQAATWADLDHWSAALAAAWAARVAPGNRVALVAANGIAHLVAELACWRLAAIAAPIFAGQGEQRIAEQIAATDPVLVVGDAAYLHALAVPVVSTASLCQQPAATFAWRAADADTPCLILATSGSTGRARGAVLTQGNLCSQQAAFAELWPEIGPGDRLAAYLPWHHSFGGLAERLWALSRGAELTLVPGGGRDHEQLIATVRSTRPTVVMSVPKIHQLLTHAGALDDLPLRWVFTAGAVLGGHEEAWYAARHIPVYEGWGLTETSPSATITRPGAPRVPGVVGTPIPGVSVGVRDDGRLLVAGPGVMAGYFRNDAATARVLTHDPVLGRVLDTGDLGAWVPAGLRLDGRADLVVKLANGEKVALAPVAEALEARPGLRHAVTLVDADRVVALCAVGADVSDETLAAQIAAVNGRLATPYARVRDTYRLLAVPSCDGGLLTPSHKVARGAWLKAFQAWQAAADGSFRHVPCA